MADEHFRTPALMPGTHCQNIFATNHFSRTFQALSKNVFTRADIALRALETVLFNGLYKLTYLLTYFTYFYNLNSQQQQFRTTTICSMYLTKKLPMTPIDLTLCLLFINVIKTKATAKSCIRHKASLILCE